TGRKVRWCDARSDSFLSDTHGRDAWAEAALAFDDKGKLLAGEVTCHANSGAYLSQMGPNAQTGNIRNNFPCVYQLPALHVRTIAAFTNVTPVGAYRGAGRPEAVYYMERAMDLAAREMGIDAVDLRRRNLIGPQQMPYKAASGLTYDSGAFETVLDMAIEASDWDGFEARRAQSAGNGLLRGRGLACYLEVTGGSAREMGGLRFEDDGSVTMVSGSLDYGQGHLTPFAQVVASRLHIPIDRLTLLQGDVDELIAGSGTGGSRTMIAAGALLLKASDLVIENGRQLSAHVLEAAEEDIEFERGQFRIAGTDRQIGILELAGKVRELAAAGAIPEDLPQSLDAETADDTPPSSFPNGAHVAEVEIDPETGVVKLVKYLVVDDFGNLINPLLVEGQVHGGVVQGVGQVLMEDVVYDENGQLLTGSYMDYAMPRAVDFPDIEFASHPVPATTNPLGAKGCGEAGCTGALPAVTNAIVDVLAREAGVTHIDLPATPEKVWAALNARN
ncbi:MAG: molybdopterin-dependent oxidoreductase, partial [Rhizobiales bacterium]|nr:molybdopterin-dependent oxidoreductase [Hyphomicrobiales bacterium]